MYRARRTWSKERGRHLGPPPGVETLLGGAVLPPRDVAPTVADRAPTAKARGVRCRAGRARNRRTRDHQDSADSTDSEAVWLGADSQREIEIGTDCEHHEAGHHCVNRGILTSLPLLHASIASHDAHHGRSGGCLRLHLVQSQSRSTKARAERRRLSTERAGQIRARQDHYQYKARRMSMTSPFRFL